MKTARFSDVVKKSGAPENYLLFLPPAKDRTLQTAIKQHRVLTVHREHVGTRKDFGEVGFHAEAHAQYLVFPRSLKPFEGKRIVAIRYELLAEAPPGKPRRESPRSPTPAKKPAPPRSKPSLPATRRPAKPRPAATPPPQPAAKKTTRAGSTSPAASSGDRRFDALKRAVEAALADLEAGRDVAAFKKLQAALSAADDAE